MVAWIALLVEKIEKSRHRLAMERLERTAKNDTQILTFQPGWI